MTISMPILTAITIWSPPPQNKVALYVLWGARCSWGCAWMTNSMPTLTVSAMPTVTISVDFLHQAGSGGGTEDLNDKLDADLDRDHHLVLLVTDSITPFFEIGSCGNRLWPAVSALELRVEG